MLKSEVAEDLDSVGAYAARVWPVHEQDQQLAELRATIGDVYPVDGMSTEQLTIFAAGFHLGIRLTYDAIDDDCPAAVHTWNDHVLPFISGFALSLSQAAERAPVE